MKTRRNTSGTFLPFDLVIEILTRLPAKSVARFRCLSKVCASTLSNPIFIDSFFTISSSRPKLLFTCPKYGKTFFFSSPKPRDSSPLAVDAEKHQWSSYIYVMPPPWKDIIEETKLRFVGTSDTGDIVLSPYNISESDSSYLLYYDPERNIMTRVGIQGMEALKSYKAYAFLDHVENIVKLEPISKLT